MKFTTIPVDATKDVIHALLRRMHKVCFPADDMPNFKEGFWWIIYSKKTPVAFCGIRSSATWLETGFMVRAGVMPRYRGNGLQKKLIRVRIAKAKRLGWKYVLTYTHDNTPSANNLIATGFRIYDPRKPYASKGSIYWRRKLN